MIQADTITAITQIIVRHYPETQAIYLFGSYSKDDEVPTSDIDIAVLLPPAVAAQKGSLQMSQCSFDLRDSLLREVDLVNVRMVSTVFQKEIINGIRIFTSIPYAAEEFEMLVISYYQKLNEERQSILNAFLQSGRAYAV